jgi:hypothetical protein
MSSKMIALAIAGAMSVPVAAQIAPQANATAPQASAEVTRTEGPKPQTVMKKVCTRVIDEEAATGSRLSNSRKVCKMVEVPAPATGQQAPATGGSSGN